MEGSACGGRGSGASVHVEPKAGCLGQSSAEISGLAFLSKIQGWMPGCARARDISVSKRGTSPKREQKGRGLVGYLVLKQKGK